MSKLEEKEHKYQQVLEVQGQNIQAESEVINQLKEEVSVNFGHEEIRSTITSPPSPEPSPYTDESTAVT